MKRHLFLTGEKGVGKSTILRLLAASWEGPVGGFRTPCRPAGEGKVVEVRSMDGQRRMEAARFSSPLHREPCNPAAFEVLARELIWESCRPGCLTVMDELGFMEAELPVFPREVLRRLDQPFPVVGALRQEENPFLAAVRAHPQVEVILVTRENRDRLPGRLAKRLHPIGEESAGEVYKEGKLW